MTIIVAAFGENGELGNENRLPWHLPEDLKHFKKITLGKPVIMGRKTYESIGKPLSGRTNIVVSRRADWFEEGILIVGSLKEALKFAKKMSEDVCIIGGGKIFEQTLEIADRLELTVVKGKFQADVFFPKLDEKIWKKTDEECFPPDEKNNFGYCFQTWERAAVV